MNKNVLRAGLLLVLGILSIWQMPHFQIAWETNQMALTALKICYGTENIVRLTNALAYFRGGAFRCKGIEAEMRAAYRETVEKPGTRFDILRILYPEDVEFAQIATETNPNQAEAYFWLGETIVAIHQDEIQQINETPSQAIYQAITAYETGLAIKPSAGEEWDQLGLLYQLTGDGVQAIHAFNQACHYVDHGKHGCIRAALLYSQYGDYDQAVLRYQDSLRQLPGHPPALKGLANALIALNRSAEAIPYLEVLAGQGDTDAQASLRQIKGVP